MSLNPKYGTGLYGTGQYSDLSATYGTAQYDYSKYGTFYLEGVNGSYTLTGGNATLSFGKQLTASAGSYSLTGYATSFVVGKALSGNAGSYAITGNAATFATGKNLNVDAGSYAITGGSASFAHNLTLTAGTFAFTLAGQAADLQVTSGFRCSPGAYALSGNAAAFVRELELTAQGGAFALTGNNATLQTGNIPTEIITRGGVTKKVKTPIKKSQRAEIEAIVKEAFDKMDGTYVPPETVKAVQKQAKQVIKQIDLNEYNVAIAHVNEILLQAQLQLAEYEAELDDEESLLMLL